MKKWNPLRRRLAELCGHGLCTRAEIDQLVEMDKPEHLSEVDLHRILARASQAGLEALDRALTEGRVVRQRYYDFSSGGRIGCIMYFLFGARSNRDMWNWEIPDDFLKAASRVIRRFDFEELSPKEVHAAVRRELRDRATVRPSQLRRAAEEDAEELCAA